MSRYLGRLEGRTALITGAARGQGEAHAELFAKEGAAVLIADVLDADGTRVSQRINSDGGRAAYVHLDVASSDEWARAIQQAEHQFGPVTALVNNAGVLSLSDVVETNADEWHHVLAINAYGTLLGMKHVVPAMIDHGGGTIVNVASIYGVIGAPGYAAYQASKGAVLSLTKSAALTYASAGVRVNTICPGLIMTQMAQDEGQAAIDALLDEIPLGRGAQPSEVSGAALFLSCDESSYITGAELVIDGGFVIK